MEKEGRRKKQGPKRHKAGNDSHKTLKIPGVKECTYLVRNLSFVAGSRDAA
jgi:hypothetical protein